MKRSLYILAFIVLLLFPSCSGAAMKKTNALIWEPAPDPAIEGFIDMAFRRVDLDAVLESRGWVGSRGSRVGNTCEAHASERAGALPEDARLRIIADGRSSRLEFDNVGGYYRISVFCDPEWKPDTILMTDEYTIPKSLLDVLEPACAAMRGDPDNLDVALLDYLEEEEAEGIGVVMYAVPPEEADREGGANPELHENDIEALHEHQFGRLSFYTIHSPEEWMLNGRLDIDRMCNDLFHLTDDGETKKAALIQSLTFLDDDGEIVGFVLRDESDGGGHYVVARCESDDGNGDMVLLSGGDETRISRTLCSMLIYAAECTPELLDECFGEFESENSDSFEVSSGEYETVGQRKGLPEEEDFLMVFRRDST